MVSQLKEELNQSKEELKIERETNQESAELMDNFYRQNPPREYLALQNILGKFSDDYLKTGWENQQLKAKIKDLCQQLEITKKLAEELVTEQQAQILQPTSSLPGSSK